MSKDSIYITLEDIPSQHKAEIIERLKVSIKAILEEYGATGITTKEGKK